MWSAGSLTRDGPVRTRWGRAGRRSGSPASRGRGSPRSPAPSRSGWSQNGRPAYRLDGDNIRQRAQHRPRFHPEGREENIRRVAEVALLFADAGLIALAALISPYTHGRRHARALHEDAGIRFVEVYMADAHLGVRRARSQRPLRPRLSGGDLVVHRPRPPLRAPHRARSRGGAPIFPWPRRSNGSSRPWGSPRRINRTSRELITTERGAEARYDEPFLAQPTCRR